MALGALGVALVTRSLVVAFFLHASHVPVPAHRPLAARTTAGMPRRPVPRSANRRAGRRRKNRRSGRSPLTAVLQARLGAGCRKATVDSRVVNRRVPSVLVLGK